MKARDRISAIEARAARVNLKLGSVCRRAGIDYSLVWRWHHAKQEPRHDGFMAVVGTLEATLDKIEDELRRQLQKAS